MCMSDDKNGRPYFVLYPGIRITRLGQIGLVSIGGTVTSKVPHV